FWDLVTGRERSLHEQGRVTGTIIGFLPDGATLVQYSDGALGTLNVATAKGQRLAALGNVLPVGSIVHTPDFQRFAFAIPDPNGRVGGDIRVVDVKQSQTLPQIRGLRPTPKRLALTADGRRVAVAGEGESPPLTV